MCGICGFTLAHENDLDTLTAMCDIMAHRGPDGSGAYIADGIALGHRRLSLIDLAGGNQPMVRESRNRLSELTSPASPEVMTFSRGDASIVFNGEIYNYQDLKAELIEDGWEFHTTSDTEVLLVAYLAWGRECLTKLRGMFAFAIYDAQTKKLFCARDFFGIKPLYYTSVQTDAGAQFMFASEIKVLLEHPACPRELNRQALQSYLSFQFSSLPETFFKGIFKLMPGHYIEVSADGAMNIERWWTPEFNMNAEAAWDETVDDIDAAMHESVRYHNVADVEVGSFLSSGIDSSYMAACLAKENPAIKTFTVGFSEYSGERDEISWARELADTLHIENNSRTINEHDFWSSLARVQWHMDEPSADPSAVALYFVDALAATKVKAVLSGEGADEFFGGYRIYQAPLTAGALSGVPKPLLRAGAKVARALGIRGANYLTRASEGVRDWYYTNANGVAFSVDEARSILKNPVDTPTPFEQTAPVYDAVADLDETTQMQYTDLHFWLVGDILLKTDKMSMAHSLESRVPFLDTGVWNTARRVPTKFKTTTQQTKLALREAAMRAIPREWAEKEKLGFPVPLAQWLRTEEYYEVVRGWFTDEVAQEFFQVDALMALLDEHKAGHKDNSRKIWIIAMFLLWYRIYFVDKCVPEKPAI